MTMFNSREVRERRLGSGLLANPFENPAVPLQAVGLDNVFGAISMTDAGESVTEESSLTIPTVFRCVQLLSTVIAGCPLRTYKKPDKVEVFPAIFDPANTLMTYTQFELWELVVVHLCLWGNAFVRKIRAGTGINGDSRARGPIVDLKPIPPERVKVKYDPETKQKIFEVKQLNPRTGVVDEASKPVILTTFEVMHIPAMGYDGMQGLGPIGYAARTMGTSVAGDKLAARFYAKGTVLSGIIKVKAPLSTQKQADTIRNKWIQKMGGVRHAAEVAVLDAETDFQPLTINPENLQFLESRRWETTEIAKMFGIPPHLMGDTEKSTSWGAGIEQQNIGFVSYTISGYTNRMEQRASREVIPVKNQYSEFDLDRLMRGSMTERFAAYSQAITVGGWMTRNEARLKENMPPKDGLDEILVPANMQGTEGPLGGEPVAPPKAPPTLGS